MDADEFKLTRKRLGLTQAACARLMGTSLTTLQKWEAPDGSSTKTAVNPQAAIMMRWLRDGWRPPEWPGKG